MTDSQIYRHTDWMDSHRKFVGEFLKRADIEYYDKGQIIDSPQGKPMKALHLVVDGTVECSFVSGSDGKKTIAGLVEGGFFIGMSALDGYLNHHTFICRTSAVVASMPVERISTWDNDMLLSLVLMQTRKLHAVNHKLISQYLAPVPQKIVRLLLELGGEPKEAGGQEIPLIVSITKQDIADLIGVSREHASKVLSEMQKNGAVTMRRKNIIFYPSKLKSLTNLPK